MKSSIFLSIFFLSSAIYCMEAPTKEDKKEEKEEVKKPKVSNIKKIVEKSRKFNPKTGKTETFESAVDAIDIRNKDALTQSTFKELIEEHENTVTDYLVAQVTTEVDGVVSCDYFDANGLLINIFGQNYLNVTKNRYNSPQINFKKNPINNQPILGLIKFYKIENLEDDKFIFVGTDYDLHQNPDQKIKQKLIDYFKEEQFHQTTGQAPQLIGKSLLVKGQLFGNLRIEKGKLVRLRPDKAIKIYNKIIEKNLPEKWQAYMKLMPLQSLTNQGQIIEYYKKAANQNEDIETKKEVLDLLISIYVRQGNLHIAKEYTEKLLKVDPNSRYANMLLEKIEHNLDVLKITDEALYNKLLSELTTT